MPSLFKNELRSNNKNILYQGWFLSTHLSIHSEKQIYDELNIWVFICRRSWHSKMYMTKNFKDQIIDQVG